jgi:hypothetical protein
MRRSLIILLSLASLGLTPAPAPVTTKPPGAFVQNHRETVIAPCEPGSRYRYRTEAFGTVVLPNGTCSASAYEENDQEIQCS